MAVDQDLVLEDQLGDLVDRDVAVDEQAEVGELHAGVEDVVGGALPGSPPSSWKLCYRAAGVPGVQGKIDRCRAALATISARRIADAGFTLDPTDWQQNQRA
ncbi:hypothetical protein ADK60_07260 [Streptomyces sp. XY431]|nr:hypothetical protein ADK60_07260 [Streptomyces sp. XY431]